MTLYCCVQVFRAGEKILDRQRFQFPPTWVYVDNVEGEWGAFNEIMKRKDAAVQAQVGSLQMKIVQEDKVVEQKTTELLQEWEKGKPVQVSPNSLLSVIVSAWDSYGYLLEALIHPMLHVCWYVYGSGSLKLEDLHSWSLWHSFALSYVMLSTQLMLHDRIIAFL